MTTKHYFRNTRTGLRYEILGHDKETNTVTLKGDYAVFTEPYDVQRFKKLGYVYEEGEDDAEQSGVRT